jgi:hypothetical protein
MPTAIEEFPRTDLYFYTMGLQYYLAGRFGALNQLTLVSGPTLHHAVEMLLKGKLAHHHSLQELKKISHDLNKCWIAFKAVFPTENLAPHDDIIDALNEFEDLRYPDNLLKFGAHVTIGLVTRSKMGAKPAATVEPGYQLSITDLDALMNRLFGLCGITPETWLTAQGNAVEFLESHNVSCQGWFPGREQRRG